MRRRHGLGLGLGLTLTLTLTLTSNCDPNPSPNTNPNPNPNPNPNQVPPLTTDAAPKRLGAATTFIAPRLLMPLRPGSAEWRLLGDRLVRGIPHETEVVLELIEHGAHARLGTASF